MWRRTFLKFPAEEGTRTPTAFRPPAPKAGAAANSATSAAPTEYNIGTKSLVPSSRFPCVLEQFQLPLPSFPSFASLRRQQAPDRYLRRRLMAHCTKCGAAVAENTAFCPACGAAQAAQNPGPASASAQSGLQENAAGALCYVIGWITGLIFFF